VTADRPLTVSEDGPARLHPGALRERTVLVAGGAGAVRNAAIQLACWAGATVITTVSSEAKAQLAGRAGAHDRSASGGPPRTSATTRPARKRLHHPIVGELDLDYEVMQLTADSGLLVAVISAEPGSRSAEAVGLLASWTATRAGRGRGRSPGHIAQGEPRLPRSIRGSSDRHLEASRKPNGDRASRNPIPHWDRRRRRAAATLASSAPRRGAAGARR
jgi:hypothetical protein